MAYPRKRIKPISLYSEEASHLLGSTLNLLRFPEAVRDINEDISPVPPVSRTIPDLRQCLACGVALVSRDEQRIHYKLDWHRLNVKRKAKGLSSIGEDEFENLDADLSSISGSESSDSDGKPSSSDAACEDGVTAATTCGSPMFYFTCDGGCTVAVYKALVTADKWEPDQKLAMDALRSLKSVQPWAIFMEAGGHFAGAVFSGSSVVVHKTFHRYVVRAKRGTVQSVRDNHQGGHHPRSAGANLRRYNELALEQDIQELLLSWSELLASCSLVFIRASRHNRKIFVGDKKSLFEKGDPRLRTIPFATQRPTFKEIQRVHSKLAAVYEVGLSEKELATSITATTRTAITRDISTSALTTIIITDNEKPEENILQGFILKDEGECVELNKKGSWDTSDRDENKMVALVVKENVQISVSVMEGNSVKENNYANSEPRNNPEQSQSELGTEQSESRTVQSESRTEQSESRNNYEQSESGTNPEQLESRTNPEQLESRTNPEQLESRTNPEQLEATKKGKKKTHSKDIDEVSGDVMELIHACKAGESEHVIALLNRLSLAKPSKDHQEATLSLAKPSIDQEATIEAITLEKSALGTAIEEMTGNSYQESMGTRAAVGIEDLATGREALDRLYNGQTLLHIAAQHGANGVVTALLLHGADPTIKNTSGKTAYLIADQKSVRDEFRRFMATYPDRWDFASAQIPSPLTAEMEEAKKNKVKLKRQAQKKAKKESTEEKKVEVNQKQSLENLSEREKRALAAEKRLMQQGLSVTAVKSAGNCSNCECSLAGLVPFEKLTYKYCTMDCLRQHKLRINRT